MAMLAGSPTAGGSWFKQNGKCFIRDPEYPNSFVMEVPCRFLEDITVPKSVIDEYLRQCAKDKKCVHQIT